MCIAFREGSMKRIDITVSEVHIKKLKTMSKKMGVSASEIIRRAIDEYWERFEKKGRGKA
jgi:metal-responsive CopG/Arc/MetJ family transcriptional regulator